MEVTYDGINIFVSEELEEILGEQIPKIEGFFNNIYITTKERPYEISNTDRRIMGVSYYYGHRRFLPGGENHSIFNGVYTHRVVKDDKTLLYYIPIEVETYSMQKKISFNKWKTKTIRLFEFYEDKIEAYSIGKSTKKLTLENAMAYIRRYYNNSWFDLNKTNESKMIFQICKYPFNQEKCFDIYIKYMKCPIVYKFMRKGLLINNVEIVNDHEKYFNKNGKTIEELSKVPIELLKEKNINNLKEYCNLVIMKQDIELSEQNQHIFDQFGKGTKRIFIDLIRFYGLDPNECINYIDNCKTYQGLDIDNIVTLFSKVCFYNTLLGETLFYPDSLKWTQNKLHRKVHDPETCLSAKAVKLIYDKKDKNLVRYLEEYGISFNFVDKGYNRNFNIKLNELKISSYRLSNEIEILDYSYEGKNLVIYKNYYHVELASINQSMIPEIEIIFIKQEAIYKINSKGTVTNPTKLNNRYTSTVTNKMIENLLEEPIFQNTGVHEIFKFFKRNQSDNTVLLDRIMIYMKSYRHLECMINRGLIKEVIIVIQGESSDSAFSGPDGSRINSIKKTLYYFNKSHIDYLLSKDEDRYHNPSVYDACKLIYDKINYMDTKIIDLIVETNLSARYVNTLLEVGFITKQNIHTVIEYVNKMVEEDVGNIYEVVCLYRDYTNMSRRLKLPSSKRYPTDLIKSHDVAVQAYNAIKDEILAEEFRNVMKDYQQYNYFDDEEDYCIVVPKELEEIIKEGVDLNHCVKSYTERIISRQTLILFVRKKDAPDTPYFTLEIYNNYVNQLRGHGNCNPPEEVSSFVQRWHQKHYKKIAKEAAKVAV